MSAIVIAVQWAGRVALPGILLLVGLGTAHAMPMPPPPDPDPRVNLDLSVQGSYTFDTETGLYTYHYLVTNRVGSGNSLKTFGLAPVEYTVAIASPAHWMGFDRWESRIDAIVWTVIENAGSLPPDSMDTGDMPPSPYCAAPGESMTCSIVSHQPPGSVTWYAQGEDSLIHVEAEHYEETLDPDDGFFGLMSVRGTTIGPDIQSVVGVSDQPPPAWLIEFRGASPNPFGTRTTLAYLLPRGGAVRLEIFDIHGRKVRALVDERRQTGPHSVDWDGIDDLGREVASGVYFVKVLVDGNAAGRHALVLLR